MTRLKVGMVGCGMVSSVYMDVFKSLSHRLELVGVIASSLQSAQDFASKHQGADLPNLAGFESIDEMLKAEKPDFILLTTPPNAREAYIESCIYHKLPVLMEKPVERDITAATSLVTQCERAKLSLGVMLQHRARPSALALREQLEAHDAGPLHAVEITVPWWREQSYYDVPGRGSYGRDGGGVMISQAIHTLDLVLQFTSEVSGVSSYRATTGFHRMEAEDFVSAGIAFSGGAHGHLMASTACFPGRAEEFWLHFKHASFNLQSAQLEVFTQASHALGASQYKIGDVAATGAGADPMAFTSDWHKAMIENFMDHLENGAPLIASGRSALKVHHLIDQIEKASFKKG